MKEVKKRGRGFLDTFSHDRGGQGADGKAGFDKQYHKYVLCL